MADRSGAVNYQREISSVSDQNGMEGAQETMRT